MTEHVKQDAQATADTSDKKDAQDTKDTSIQDTDKAKAAAEQTGAEISKEAAQAAKPEHSTKVQLDIAVPGMEGLQTVVLALDADKAPKTVECFLAYVQEQHYDDTIFHRVIDGFMVQGGGFTADMTQKKAPRTVQNEANNGLKNRKYTVAMARTQDPHSASAQFFINVADNEFLDHRAPSIQGWGYCVFGQVIEGEAVIDHIRSTKTGKKGFHSDVPKEPVVIKKAVLLDKAQAANAA